MASDYGYITEANLEAFMGIDFSAVDSRYTSTVTEMWISTAEQTVNAYCNQSFSGTIPDGVKAATKQIAARVATNQLVRDGHVAEAGTAQQSPYITLPASDMENLLGDLQQQETLAIKKSLSGRRRIF
jgi:hypothetical protein